MWAKRGKGETMRQEGERNRAETTQEEGRERRCEAAGGGGGIKGRNEVRKRERRRRLHMRESLTEARGDG